MEYGCVMVENYSWTKPELGYITILTDFDIIISWLRH